MALKRIYLPEEFQRAVDELATDNIRIEKLSSFRNKCHENGERLQNEKT